MKHIKIFYPVLAVLLILNCTISLKAQNSEDKLTVTPTGRILMDAGIYNSSNESFHDGVAIPDFRVGAKASYGKFKAKLDVGYAYGKIGIKDIFVERSFDKNNLLRVGHFVHQFGLQSSTSSSMKITMEEPTSNEAFFNSRLTGAMWIHDKNAFFGTLSAFVENETMKKSTDEMGNPGYGAMSRLVYRPLREPGKIFHVGISGAYETPRYNSDEDLNHSSFVLKANFPTRIAKVKAIEASITDAKNLFKFTPEITAAYGRLGLEAQYFYVQVNRKDDFKNYKASGAYAILRGLIIGDSFKYSNPDSGIATPAPGSLEAVLGFNYTDMSDHKADIRGGRLSDFNAGFNYYLNKYMIWRFRYSYTKVTDRAGFDNTSLNAFQTRFQIIF